MDEIVSKLHEIAKGIDVETADLDALLLKSALLTVLGVLQEEDVVKRSWLVTLAIFHSGHTDNADEIISILRESMR